MAEIKNISYNCRDFGLSPQKVSNWKKQQGFNLTLSVIIGKQEEFKSVFETIKNEQNEIIKSIGVKEETISENPYLANGLYKYGENNFHFSLINFLACNLTKNGKFENGSDLFDEFSGIYTKEKNYEKFLELVKGFYITINILKRKRKLDGLKLVMKSVRWIRFHYKYFLIKNL